MTSTAFTFLGFILGACLISTYDPQMAGMTAFGGAVGFLLIYFWVSFKPCC